MNNVHLVKFVWRLSVVGLEDGSQWAQPTFFVILVCDAAAMQRRQQQQWKTKITTIIGVCVFIYEEA